MSQRSNVSPATLGIELQESGIAVRYIDGREVFYHGVPETVSGTLRTPPGKEVHVLVTDPTETEGVMVYVNDLKTHDDVLESTGVGRVLVESGEREEVFPGVEVRSEGHRVFVEGDPEIARGRVFVFAEDEMSEHAYEMVNDAEE
ncbi:DUF5796 family protein [Halalkalicoccus jeotgali]|uniref:Uncharacterized protein n=1 Tax=Halalkalicoccus jeotgali (strain DSM 18796 / CECT 7217 / JCM 14584 / KCTC 4019 / B3) TaxID=795797 RepID=D8J3F3_HALJB|nr:DUF5796 family protein [Halalkalicoccus jeotgali]ADJ15260.1 hypothetical protein HacjB3_09385 [Halalkalicoccus jeotgali B3]ELY35319.1 hypothetical protein C497_13291 [Halalkalicoccus jeotgali B3]